MRPLPQRFLLSLAATASVVLLILTWWRNHALLVDFFDYGLVMAAAGRMQLGDSPYVDFISPIQTLQFLGAMLAERLGGARYLSMTYAGIVFILASFAGLTALLWRTWGAGLALLTSVTIVVASAGQHTIIWYNAMGVIWLAIVVWITAQPRSNQRGEFWRLALVWVALWLGGMTKLTFQAAALAFAITFTVRAATVDSISWRAARLRILSFVGFGVIAPIATEMWATGATLEQWITNVLILPARFRTDMLGQIATWKFYLQTPHDYYHPLVFKFAGAWGVVLLVLTTLIIAAGLRAKTPRARNIDWVMLAIMGVGAWICSAVLLATNMDIAYLSAAVPLVLAIGLALAFSTPNAGVRQYWIRWILGGAAVSLLVPAGLAAWAGTRALWGHEPLDRAAMVATDDLPARFSYLRGMKILPNLHADLQTLDQTMDELVVEGIPPKTWHFTHATEWMVRVAPEARHAGLPLWFARGTTFTDDETWEIAEYLEGKAGVRVIFSYEGWNYWFEGMQALLKERFQHRVIGRRLHVYQRREPLDPIEFAVNTHSNLHAGMLTVNGGPAELGVLSNGLFYLGGKDPHRIDVGFGLFRLEGELIGELQKSDPERATKAIFRIFARENGRLTDKLWEETVEVSPDARSVIRPFSISPGGRPVTLTMHLPDDASANFGWRKLHTEHVGTLEPENPFPLDQRLKRNPVDDAAMAALQSKMPHAVAEVRTYGTDMRAGVRDGAPEFVSSVPGEVWIKLIPPFIHVAGEFKISERGADESAPTAAGLRVTVVAYKAGRFDVRCQRELHPGDNPADRDSQAFETWLPENSGWIGLIVTSLDGKAISADSVEWRSLRIW